MPNSITVFLNIGNLHEWFIPKNRQGALTWRRTEFLEIFRVQNSRVLVCGDGVHAWRVGNVLEGFWVHAVHERKCWKNCFLIITSSNNVRFGLKLSRKKLIIFYELLSHSHSFENKVINPSICNLPNWLWIIFCSCDLILFINLRRRYV